MTSLATRAVERIGEHLARRPTRRSFLVKTAVVGSALATRPWRYLTRPGTAYASLCGPEADCASGWTVFCCSINNGENTCPPGTIPAGWWKADGSAFCGGGPRYILDCNATCGSCGCGSSGICAPGCHDWKCHCGTNDCDQRRVACNNFRYGQCHQEVACVGPVVCRVATCMPPWEWEPTCTTTAATANATANHSAPCLHGATAAVSAFGAARDLGEPQGRLRSPVTGMDATPSGNGYWLVAEDGGVFAFGDARFFGSAAAIDKHAPVIAAAPTRSGNGYWLLSVDGGVFAFGDAAFRGSRIDLGTPAVGIAAAPDGSGYWVVRANGGLHAFGAPHLGDVVGLDPAAARHPTVGIAARARGGYWIAQGETPPAVAPAPDLSQHPFLVCTRRIESGGNYAAVNPSGTYRGAYQFSRSTWDSTARHAGRFDLVGVDPAAAAPHDQDFMALHLFEWQGARPWGGRCA